MRGSDSVPGQAVDSAGSQPAPTHVAQTNAKDRQTRRDAMAKSTRTNAPRRTVGDDRSDEQEICSDVDSNVGSDYTSGDERPAPRNAGGGAGSGAPAPAANARPRSSRRGRRADAAAEAQAFLQMAATGCFSFFFSVLWSVVASGAAFVRGWLGGALALAAHPVLVRLAVRAAALAALCLLALLFAYGYSAMVVESEYQMARGCLLPGYMAYRVGGDDLCRRSVHLAAAGGAPGAAGPWCIMPAMLWDRFPRTDGDPAAATWSAVHGMAVVDDVPPCAGTTQDVDGGRFASHADAAQAFERICRFAEREVIHNMRITARYYAMVHRVVIVPSARADASLGTQVMRVALLAKNAMVFAALLVDRGVHHCARASDSVMKITTEMLGVKLMLSEDRPHKRRTAAEPPASDADAE